MSELFAKTAQVGGSERLVVVGIVVPWVVPSHEAVEEVVAKLNAAVEKRFKGLLDRNSALESADAALADENRRLRERLDEVRDAVRTLKEI